jgi:integrase
LSSEESPCKQSALSESDLCHDCTLSDESYDEHFSSDESDSSQATDVAENVHGRKRTKLVEAHMTGMNLPTYDALIQPRSVVQTPSQVRKYNWAKQLWESFCQIYNLACYPISGDTVYGFFMHLGETCDYAVSSLENVIYPKLQQLYKDKCHAPMPDLMCARYRDALRTIKQGKKESPFQKVGKDAAIASDVAWIIKCIPDGYIYKAEQASLFSFAAQTGARAVSCAFVHLEDIIRAQVHEDGQVQIQVLLMRTKGVKQGLKHPINLRGSVSANDAVTSVNCLYWLEQHLQQKWGLSLLSWNYDQVIGQFGVQQQRLWPYTEDDLSSKFRKAAKYAGYPAGLLSFHSLRSGFLCTALLTAGSRQSMEKAMEYAAFVAMWKPYGRAQNLYV